MSFVIDLVIIAVFVLCIIFARKKGFILTVIDIAAVGIAVVAAKYIGDIAGGIVYDKFIHQKVSDYLGELFASGALSGETISAKVTEAFGFLPDTMVAALKSAGMFKASNFDLTGIVDTAGIETKLIAPLLTSLCKTAVYVILTIVLTAVIKLVARFFRKFLTPKPLKKLDTDLGGIIGVAKGGAYGIILANLLNVFAYFNEDIYDLVSSSRICGLVAQNLNFMDLFVK